MLVIVVMCQSRDLNVRRSPMPADRGERSLVQWDTVTIVHCRDSKIFLQDVAVHSMLSSNSTTVSARVRSACYFHVTCIKSYYALDSYILGVVAEENLNNWSVQEILM